MPSLLVISCCSIQWFVVGYSLAYGEGSGVIGDLKYAFHRGVLADPIGTIPAILFSEFQLIFEATVCAIAVGGAVERGRTLPLIPFIFVSLNQDSILADDSDLRQAMVNVHLLSLSAYGMGRRVPGRTWCA
jgi:ammonia channel protein AmtB